MKKVLVALALIFGAPFAFVFVWTVVDFWLLAFNAIMSKFVVF